jgi:hypothetical protein
MDAMSVSGGEFNTWFGAPCAEFEGRHFRFFGKCQTNYTEELEQYKLEMFGNTGL